MDETRELGQALIQLRRASYQGATTLTKSLDPLELKADGGKGEADGYASKWWVVDSYGECTAPGCFLQSINDRGPKGANRIPVRYEHEYTVGTHKEMVEDEIGLYIKTGIVDDGMYGTVLRRQLDAGVPYGWSIGFRSITGRPATPEDPLIWDYAPRWLRENPDPANVWVLQQTKLMEDSAVTFPAVEPATIDSYRSDANQHLERLLAGVKAGTLTDPQIRLLHEITAQLPAATTPESGQVPPLPGAKADSTADDLLFLNILSHEYERLTA